MTARKLVHINDTSDHGGYMITANGTVRAEGLRLCIEGDIHRCPLFGHGDTVVHTSTTRIRTNRKGMIRDGDYAECGARIIGSGRITAKD